MTAPADAPPDVDYAVLDPALRQAAPQRFAATLDGFLGEFYATLAHASGQAADGAALARMRARLASGRPLTHPLA